MNGQIKMKPADMWFKLSLTINREEEQMFGKHKQANVRLNKYFRGRFYKNLEPGKLLPW